MKSSHLHLILILFILLINITKTVCQEVTTNNASPFKIVVNYEYFKIGLKVESIKYYSIWAGQDFGYSELSSEEVDELNSFTDIHKTVQGPVLQFGWIALNKKKSPIYLDVNLFAGLAIKNYETINSQTESLDLNIKSKNVNHWYGTAINLIYYLNNKWGIRLNPSISYSWGETDKIIDNLNPIQELYNENRLDKSSIFYGRLNLQAVYLYKNFQFSLGPGFYYASNKHKLTIERLHPENNTKNTDTYDTQLISKNIIDANFDFLWRISSNFSVHFTTAFANDFFVLGGISYHL